MSVAGPLTVTQTTAGVTGGGGGGTQQTMMTSSHVIPPIPEVAGGEISGTESLHSSELTTDNDPDMRATYGTPDSDLPLSRVLNSDITIQCAECLQYIDLEGLREHRNYHDALRVMGYSVEQPVLGMTDLLARRKLLIQQYIPDTYSEPESPVNASLVQRINEAFEILRSEVENTFDGSRKIRENRDYEQRGFALSCSADSVLAVGVCSNANARWRTAMQDTRVYQDCFGSDDHKAFFAIYDGHHGPYAAEVAAEHLHHALLNQMARFDRRTKCDCTYNLAEYEQSLKEPHEVHSRVTSKYTERGELYQESVSVIHKLISDCEKRILEMLASGEQKPDNGNNGNGTRTKEKVSRDPFSLKMGNAFDKAYHYTDMLLAWGKDEASRVRWSGCSALTCVIQDTKDEHNQRLPDSRTNSSAGGSVHSKQAEDEEEEATREGMKLEQLGIVHLANAGNVRGLLVRDNKPYRISRDHTPHNRKEKIRVLKTGGQVSNNERDLLVNGVLTTTRGLGNHGDPPLKKVVLKEPYTTSVPIDQYAQCLILASRGVWEVFSDNEAAQLVVQLLPPNHLKAPSRISESINRLLARTLTPSTVLGGTTAGSSRAHSRMTDVTSHRSTLGDNISTYNPDGLEAFKQRKSATRKPSRPNTSKSILSTGSRVSHASQVSFASDVEAPAHTSSPAESVSEELIEEQLSTDSNHLQQQQQQQENNNTDNNVGDATTNARTGSGRSGRAAATQTPEERPSSGDGSRGTTSLVDSSAQEHDSGMSGHDGDLDDTTMSRYSDMSHSTELSSEAMYKQFGQVLAERLTEAALMAGARDNVTVMVILLPGCGLVPQ